MRPDIIEHLDQQYELLIQTLRKFHLQLSNLHRATLTSIEHHFDETITAIETLHRELISSYYSMQANHASDRIPNIQTIHQKILTLLDKLTQAAHEQSSPLLQAQLKQLNQQREQLISSLEEPAQPHITNSIISTNPQQIKVYILLYQAFGNNLQAWLENIQATIQNTNGKAIYKTENQPMNIIKNKLEAIENHGYLTILVNEEDCIAPNEDEDPATDAKIFSLKNGALSLKSIVEFVHKNRDHYRITTDGNITLEKIPSPDAVEV